MSFPQINGAPITNGMELVSLAGLDLVSWYVSKVYTTTMVHMACGINIESNCSDMAHDERSRPAGMARFFVALYRSHCLGHFLGSFGTTSRASGLGLYCWLLSEPSFHCFRVLVTICPH